MLKSIDMDENTSSKKAPYIRLSCNVLKLIACIIMAIDHIGYGLIHNYQAVHGMDLAPETYMDLQKAYDIAHGVGRLAFPIFCFFIVEGFLRTRNVYKYAIRLGIFAVLSEIPFDLGLYGVLFNWKHQNIILTFFMALIMLIILRFLETNVIGLSNTVVYLAYISAIIGFADLANLVHTDYSWKCILLVAVLYFARKDNALRLIAGAAATSWEKYGPISFVLLYFYDPDIRPRFKYAFYLFYPLHLFLIYLIGRAII